MFTAILKSIPFFIQAILVVAAVAVFAYFDPFDIFVSSKKRLKDTPVDVQSIKSIRKLITAEYYGEVVRSYAHQAVEEDENEISTMEETVESIHDQFLLVTDELRQALADKDIRKRQVYDRYKELMGEWRTDGYYEPYMYFMFIRLFKEDQFKDRHLDNRLSDNREERLVKRVVDARIDNAEGLDLKPLFDTFRKDVEKEREKKFRKSNLVMLGRGWVKAGFDFEDFSEDHFRYDADRGVIYFIGFRPEILSATINPWFIPEKGVEGFEFLIVERKVRRDYKVVQRVKQMCLDELKRKAFERNILEAATTNARESLKEFFSLLLGKEIRDIVFYENELEFAYTEIAKNDSISGEELLLIEHLLDKTSYLGIDSTNEEQMNEQRYHFKAELQKVPVYLFGENVAKGWSPQWTAAYEVASDGVYDEYWDRLAIQKYTAKYCADTVVNKTGADSTTWSHRCASDVWPFVKNHVQVFISRDSSLWSDPTFRTQLTNRLTSEDSLWAQPKNQPRKLVGLRIGLDEHQQPLDSVVIGKEGKKLCECEAL